MTNILRWKGIYKIQVRKNGIVVKEFKKNNLVTNAARDELIKPLYNGGNPDIEIKYLAIGTGTTTPSASDTTLVNETYRIADHGLSRQDIGNVVTEFTILGTDYSGLIEEIGIFAGSTASATKDTGILVSRILLNYTISVDEELYFLRIDVLGG